MRFPGPRRGESGAQPMGWLQQNLGPRGISRGLFLWGAGMKGGWSVSRETEKGGKGEPAIRKKGVKCPLGAGAFPHLNYP